MRQHKTSLQEMSNLLKLIDRDLRDAGTPGLSADWKLTIGYNAALQCAIAALAASGYRPGRGGSAHYYAIESLRFTIGMTEDDVRAIDAFRKKRNIADYEKVGTISSTEAEEMVQLAREIRDRLIEWLGEGHPELLSP